MIENPPIPYNLPVKLRIFQFSLIYDTMIYKYILYYKFFYKYFSYPMIVCKFFRASPSQERPLYKLIGLNFKSLPVIGGEGILENSPGLLRKRFHILIPA